MLLTICLSRSNSAPCLFFNHTVIMFVWQREEIRFMVERDGSAKAIVFSQFTSFLDLIHYTLGKVSNPLRSGYVNSLTLVLIRLKPHFVYNTVWGWLCPTGGKYVHGS